jgi:hypothetical protein
VPANEHWTPEINQVLRKQFPLVPEEAVTVRKAQGSTYNEVAISLTKGMDRTCLYVACSRVTNSSGLYVIGEFCPPAPSLPSHPASTEMFRMHRSATVQLAFNNIIYHQKNLFHNVQSLPKHRTDLISDCDILSADMIITVENWSLPSDSLNIPGFRCVQSLEKFYL